MATIKRDTYQIITDKIIAALEGGERPWMRPWGNGSSRVSLARPLRHSGVAYQGINTILLWMEAQEKGYNSRYWMTFKQAIELGGHVRKGEKSTLVVYAGAIEKEEETQSGETVERRIPFLKSYCVFNADQIDDLPQHYYFKSEPMPGQDQKKQRIEKAELFFRNLGANIREGGNAAYYCPVADYVQMPPFECFYSAEAFAGVLAHELTHWTAAKHRLNRDLSRYAADRSERAREELIAELGSCFICADLGIEMEPREDHAAYIGAWVKVLRNDKRAIVQAASHAEKAAAYMHSLQPHSENTDEDISVAA